MRLFIAVVLLACSAVAQSGSAGYAYYAPTLVKSYRSHSWAQGAGAGFDTVLWRGIGAGGDLGWFWPSDQVDNGVGLLSVNGFYHFSPTAKLDPFVTAGYGLMFRSGSLNMANFGGGVNWWARDNLGLRFEVRDHSDFHNRSDHFISFRVGLLFR